jgi:hypothetical protein
MRQRRGLGGRALKVCGARRESRYETGPNFSKFFQKDSERQTVAGACGGARRRRWIAYLLDIHIVSEMSHPRPNAAVVAWISAAPADQLFLSAVALREL